MLNPDLKNDINIEIEKAPLEIKEFLLGNQFRHNMDLIIRVNKLTETEGESLELEVILIALGISNYKTIDEALAGEEIVINPATIRQIASDVNTYILGYIKPVMNNLTVTPVEVSAQPDRVEVSLATRDESSLPLREQIVSSMTLPHLEKAAEIQRSEIEEIEKVPEINVPIIKTDNTDAEAVQASIMKMPSSDDEHSKNITADPYLESIDPADLKIEKK